MSFDRASGQLSGTPTETGVFTFSVRVAATNQPALEPAYTFAITSTNEVLPPHSTIDTVAFPLDSGDIVGLGLYTNGHTCTVSAASRPGYRFSHWTDKDTLVSTNATYQFPVTLNRSLVANFIPGPPDVRLTSLSPNSHQLEWTTNGVPVVLEQTSDFVTWTGVNAPVSAVGTNAGVTLPTLPGPRFSPAAVAPAGQGHSVHHVAKRLTSQCPATGTGGFGPSFRGIGPHTRPAYLSPWCPTCLGSPSNHTRPS